MSRAFSPWRVHRQYRHNISLHNNKYLLEIHPSNWDQTFYPSKKSPSFADSTYGRFATVFLVWPMFVDIVTDIKMDITADRLSTFNWNIINFVSYSTTIYFQSSVMQCSTLTIRSSRKGLNFLHTEQERFGVIDLWTLQCK